jgi:MinD-like ATPase involved in chromosome partitioning or flagellar assembly
VGEIVTFYSYKGGTGRTMALANVAWILAAAGHRVLMVDWDLEAPGLHRYFHPFLRDRELLTSQGVIDIVIDFAVQATTPASTDEDRKKTWYLPLADVLRYAMSIDWDFGKGQLDLLPAGQQSASYATRVNSFNWDNFYERLGGGTFLEALRSSMLENYHYVLIDSRTGVSDTSGICTVQLPDSVVVCFTLNRQSIEGAAATARSIVDARAKTQRGTLRLFPVPTRVEKAETFKLEAARAASRTRFAPFLSHLPDASPAKYWDEIEIAYQPYYAYEELLAAFRDPSPSVGTVLYSMERLAARLTGKRTIEWKQPADDRRSSVLGSYGWISEQPTAGGGASVKAPVGQLATAQQPIAPEVPPHPPIGTAKGPQPSVDRGLGRPYWFYVSYAPVGMDDVLERFVRELDDVVRQRAGAKGSTGFFDVRNVKIGQEWDESIVDAITRSRTALCLLSQNYLYSESCGREFSLFQHFDMPIVPVSWEPVQIDLPPAFKAIQMNDEEVPARVRSSGLRATIRISRYRNEYQRYLEVLAERVVRLGQASPTAVPREAPRFNELPNAFRSKDAPAAAGSVAVFACLASEAWTWRPYGSQTIRDLAERAATEERFAFSAITSDDLYSKLLRVSDSRQIWMLLVEAAQFNQSVRDLVTKLEAHRSWGQVVLVERGGEDSSRARNVEATTQPAGWTLRSVTSEAELTATIRRELLSIRTEMLRDAVRQTPAQAPTSVTLPKITP